MSKPEISGQMQNARATNWGQVLYRSVAPLLLLLALGLVICATSGHAGAGSHGSDASLNTAPSLLAKAPPAARRAVQQEWWVYVQYNKKGRYQVHSKGYATQNAAEAVVVNLENLGHNAAARRVQ